MPTSASTVGPFVLPVPAGAALSAVDDPTLSGLGAYLAFWLNFDLNPKLASLQTGRSADGSAVTTAVPTGNIFPWDPLKPLPLFIRGKQDGAAYNLPALYVSSVADKRKSWSQLHGMRERQVKVCWIFAEATLPGWQVDRYGLRACACATLFRAVEQRYHPGYNARETIAVQLSLAGEGIVYQGAEQVMLSVRPTTKAGQAEQPVVRAYPAVIASYLVYEREDGMMATPADATQDLALVTSVGDDPQFALEVAEHVVPAPPYPDDV